MKVSEDLRQKVFADMAKSPGHVTYGNIVKWIDDNCNNKTDEDFKFNGISVGDECTVLNKQFEYQGQMITINKRGYVRCINEGASDCVDIFDEDNDGVSFSLREVSSQEEIGDVKDAEKWLKSVLPHIPVSVRQGLLKINNIKAWGMVSKAGITLSNIMAKGTEYHEAFHTVSRYALTEEERSTLYKEASYYTKSSDETTNEEWLAERFREFMTDRNSLMK